MRAEVVPTGHVTSKQQTRKQPTLGGKQKRKAERLPSEIEGDHPAIVDYEYACNKKLRVQDEGANLKGQVLGVVEAGNQPRRSL